MTAADAIFAQADLNNDQRLDLNEFRNLLGAGGISYGASSYGAATDLTGLGAGDGYGSSSYQSSSYESSTTGGALGGGLAYTGAGLAGAGIARTGLAGAGYGGSSYESLSYSSSGSNVGGDLDLGGAAGLEGTVRYGGAVGVAGTDLSTTNYSTTSQTTAVQQYETDAQGLFKDSNPQVIRRPAPGGGVTYTQNIRVRFLQPPPVPPPGPLIIKEVRPPQPPVPPPLHIRQRAPSVPQPPPLILRERPPVPPASVASQTVIRRLAALPVPPRSVIIERLPALPAKPRDIIIERWIPYGAVAKRKTIVQRAENAKQYPEPRNIIIQYEPVQVRIVRQFQRLGVTQENPAAYVQRYGATLLDSQSLVQQARAAGVVEDITAPAVASSLVSVSSAGTLGGVTGLDVGVAGLGGVSSYESSSYSATTDGVGLGAGVGGASSYESSSYSSTTDNLGLDAGVVGAGLGGGSSYKSSYSATTNGLGLGAGAVGTGFGGVSSYESSSYSSSTGTTLGSGAVYQNSYN